MSLSSEEQLKAWENWKAICSISGCRPDAPAILERIARKEGNKELYGKYYEYMRNQVSKWIKDASGKKCGCFVNNFEQFKEIILMDSGCSRTMEGQVPADTEDGGIWQKALAAASGRDYASASTDEDDAVQNSLKTELSEKEEQEESEEDKKKSIGKKDIAWKEALILKLDSMIYEYYTRPETGTSLKSYKDKIWFDAWHRETPPMQTIAGSFKFLMMTMAEKIIRQYCNVRPVWAEDNENSSDSAASGQSNEEGLVLEKDQDGEYPPNDSGIPDSEGKKGKKKKRGLQILPHESLDAPVNGVDDSDDAPALIDSCPYILNPFEEDEKNEQRPRLPETAGVLLKICENKREKLLLLGLLAGLNLTDPLVLRCMQGGRNICTRTQENLRKKMRKHRNEFSDLICTDHGKKILKQALIDDLKSEKCAAPLLSFIENANNNTEE